MVALTDAEQSFADSAEGRAAIAYERYKHRLSEGHKGANAQPWTDGLEASTVRRLATDQARNRIQSAAMMADYERQAPVLQAAADTAHKQMVDRLHNGWRK